MNEFDQDRVRGQNGLPEFRPYRYQGTGADTLTPGLRVRRSNAEVAAERAEIAALSRDARCNACGYLLRAKNHKWICG